MPTLFGPDDDPKKKSRQLAAEITEAGSHVGVAARDATELNPRHATQTFPPDPFSPDLIMDAFFTPFYERLPEKFRERAGQAIGGVQQAMGPGLGQKLFGMLAREIGPVDLMDVVSVGTVGLGAALGHKVLARDALENAAAYGRTLRHPGRSIFPGPRAAGLLESGERVRPNGIFNYNVALDDGGEAYRSYMAGISDDELIGRYGQSDARSTVEIREVADELNRRGLISDNALDQSIIGDISSRTDPIPFSPDESAIDDAFKLDNEVDEFLTDGQIESRALEEEALFREARDRDLVRGKDGELYELFTVPPDDAVDDAFKKADETMKDLIKQQDELLGQNVDLDKQFKDLDKQFTNFDKQTDRYLKGEMHFIDGEWKHLPDGVSDDAVGEELMRSFLNEDIDFDKLVEGMEEANFGPDDVERLYTSMFLKDLDPNDINLAIPSARELGGQSKDYASDAKRILDNFQSEGDNILIDAMLRELPPGSKFLDLPQLPYGPEMLGKLLDDGLIDEQTFAESMFRWRTSLGNPDLH